MDVDDMPVGAAPSKAGGNPFGSEFPDEQPPQDKPSNKSLDEKLISKKWNERASAYEELSELLKTKKSSDPIFYDHNEGFKKYLADNNPGALEKAVDCYIEFVKRAPNSIISDMKATAINLLISKSIAHLKPTLQEKGLEAICCIIENTEDFEGVSEAVCVSCKSTNVKAASAGCTTIIHLVKCFGIIKFPLKQMLGAIEKAVGSKQAAVRQTALSFYEECYKWIGEAIKPAVEKLNKPQQDELEKLFNQFKESGEPKPKPTRVTKKEEENQKQAQLDEIVAKEQEEEEKENQMLDLAEEKDALASFDEAWADATLGLKKWNEKKEKLEGVNNQINTPKIKTNPNVKAVMRVCEKMIKDSNMNVYDETVKLIGYLAIGLKREFHEEAKMMVGPILSNIKKRPNIIQNVSDTLEAMLKCVDLEDVIGAITTGLGDRSPLIVKQACIYLQKGVNQTYIDDLKKVYDSFCPNLAKLANHQDGELRDIGLATLGLIKGRIGDSIDKYTSNLNQQKLDKVKEAAGEYQLTKYDKPKNPPKAKKKKEEAKAEMTESEAMVIETGPPKKKKKAKPKGPPASFFKRQEEMKNKAQEKMEEIKAELKGEAPPTKSAPKIDPPPTASTDRPQTAAPVRKKAKLVIDESGPGVAKEDADGIITEHCSSSILKGFEEAKWQDKVEAYSKFAAWLNEQEYSNEVFEAAFWYIKIKQKEWKEKNVNLVKAALNFMNEIVKVSCGMSKRAATIILPFLSENVGDPKYNALCKENLLSLSELVSPGFVAKNCCKHASSAKSPNVLVENNKVLTTILEEFGPQGLPVQDMINYGIICCDNKNVKVRNETITMLSTLYKHLGEGIRKFLKDIKDSTLAVINSEFDKITPYQKGEFHSKREIVNEEIKQEMEANGAADDPLESLPRADVGKELGGQKLMTMINDKNWKKRKEAVDKMDGILEKANCRILPNGLSEIVGQLKVKMADSNKSVSKAFIQFVGKFAEALGPGAKQYAPMLIKPLLRCLSEKNTLVRNINLEAINKWSAAIGPENIINHIGKVIEKENPEIRTVLLDWILEHKASIPACESGTLPKPLIECLQDKAPSIKSMAEKVIVEVLPFSGASPFKKLMKDLKPAVQNSIKPIIEKCIANSDTGDVEMADDAGDKTTKSDKSGKTNKSKRAGPAKPVAEKKNMNSSINSSSSRPKTAQVLTAKQIYEKLNKNKAGAKKKDGEESDGLAILDIGNKSKRNEADKKKRWHPEEIRDDYITKFKNSTKTVFGDAMAIKMFTTDFKTLIKCLKQFSSTVDSEDGFTQFIDIMDIVIKWAYIKSNEVQNTSFLKDLYMFFDKLVDKLIETQYEFLEAEGTIFCLCLVEKVGINNPTLKEKVKEIIIKVGTAVTLFHPKKLITILMKGLDSKSSKTTAECLELIAMLIQTHQLEVINEKDVKAIGKIVDNSDNGIRQGALSACEEIYKIAGEHFWELVGAKLSSKAEDIIRARFKAKLGVPLNSTPIEDKKEQSTKSSKSPMIKRDRSTNKLQKSLNSSLGLNSSHKSSRIGRNAERNTNIQGANTAVSAPKSHIEPVNRRRKESSVNRKLEKIEANAEKQEQLDNQLDAEISKMEESDEIKQEIETQDMDNYMEQDENLDSIGKCIKQLKYGDLSAKVDALVIINEVISRMPKSSTEIGEDLSRGNRSHQLDDSQESLVRNSNFMIDSISKVFFEVFSKTPEKIPLKFGKYFISIVSKVCSIRDVMRNVEENKILILVEQLMLKLLLPGLDSLGEKGEGQAMFRNLNNTILRILEHCHPTIVFVVFLTLLKKYKGYDKIEKLPGIIVKCLLKVTRIMDQLINIINIQRVLLSIHEYLIKQPFVNSAKADEVGIRITKTIINEIVKIKKDDIWEYYEGVEAHTTQDIYIKKWIQTILMSLNGGVNPNSSSTSSRQSANTVNPDEYTGGLSAADHRRMKILISEATCGNQFKEEQACKSITEFSDDYPSLDLDTYLQKNSDADGYNKILNGILKSKKRKQIGGRSAKNMSTSFSQSIGGGLKSKPRFGTNLNATGGKNNRLSTMEKLQEYEEKRANLRQRFGAKKTASDIVAEAKGGTETKDMNSSSNLKPEGKGATGSTIAAMNSSITEKWRKINSKGAGGLNNTVGGGFKSSMNNKSTLDKESNEGEGNENDGERSAKTKLALQARLNEVKARLGKIKKSHDPR